MPTAKGYHRVSTTLDDKAYEQIKYWADRREMSINDYLAEALLFRIAWENGDYKIPTAEQARQNQIIDLLTVLSRNVQSVEQTVVHGFDSLLGLTRGDNYLIDTAEDGEI